MTFPLKTLTEEQRKWLRYFVLGAVYVYNDEAKVFSNLEDYENYIQDTLTKMHLYLTGKQEADASFTDFQCNLALEVRQLFNPTPIGFVTNGDVEYTCHGQLPPNFGNGIQNEAQARFWMTECNLRVLPVYLGNPLN